MINLKKLGDRIRLLRNEKKLTQENIANDLGISTTAYSKIERGVTNVSISRLQQIADVLGVDIRRITQFQQEGTGGFPVQESGKHYGEFDTMSLIQRIHEQQDEIVRLQKMLADKEEIIALLKEKLAK